ncbi:MAG: DinB family protein [Cyclobacteriaceae bacterium]|nr:DinB family protein [Cyclobacteriaceae bacterium]
MAAETERIVRSLAKTFDKGPWYGPSLMDVLNQVKPEQANLRIGETHSILELVLHMISWRTFAARRLRGDNTFEVSEQENFPSPSSVSWADALSRLKKSQEELIVAASEFPEARLGELVPSKTQRYTYYTLLHGINQHDIYHIGQISLILKSVS